MPMLARLLATHHGFDCTVLFCLDEDGLVDPTQKIRWQDETVQHDVPGLEHLASADLMILFSRLITLPDEQLEHIYAYLDAGKPIIGLRTANHGFIGFDYELDGKRINFGEAVLGGSFRKHHGRWSQDSTRGTVVEANCVMKNTFGITATIGGNAVTGNRATGNTTADYNNSGGVSSFGQVLDVSGMSFFNNTDPTGNVKF